MNGGNGFTHEVPIELQENESPFLDGKEVYEHTSFETSGTTEDLIPKWSLQDEAQSPFLNVYHTSSVADAETISPVQVAFEELLTDLHDEEFDEAVVELVNEAEAFYKDRMPNDENNASYHGKVEQLLNHHFEPLIMEAETLLDSMAERAERTDFRSMQDDEIDRVFDDFVPRTENPVFDFFLKRLRRKARRVAKKAVKMARKGIKKLDKVLPISQTLKKIKALVKPLLKKVLKMAIGRLPTDVQPIARKLAKKYLNLEAEEYFAGEAADLYDEEIASINYEIIQHELDATIAVSMTSEYELEPVQMLQEVASSYETYETDQPAAGSEEDYDKIRERFVHEFSQLQEGENPTPVIERFVPALIPVLKTGLKLIGRDRVVKFLSGYAAKLMGKFVGAKGAKMLARPVVSEGLRMIGLETPEQPDERISAEIVAYTIEDFVGRMAGYDQEALEDPEILQYLAQAEFEESVASYFPSPLLKQELQENSIGGGSWIPHKYYLKYNKTPKITLTAAMAKNIVTFSGRRLYDEVQIEPNQPVTTSVFLYKATRKTRLSRISKYDRSLGFNSWAKKYWSQIHYLDKNAAGILFQNPSFGVNKSNKFVQSRHMIAVGQVFYVLPDMKPRGSISSPPPPQGKRSSLLARLNYEYKTIPLTDIPYKAWGNLYVKMYFSEPDAKNIVDKFKKGENFKAIQFATEVFKTEFANARRRNNGITVVRKKNLKEYIAPAVIGEWILKAFLTWLVKKGLDLFAALVKKKLKERTDYFITSQESPAEGLMVKITIPYTVGGIKGLIPLTKASRFVGLVRDIQFTITPGGS